MAVLWVIYCLSIAVYSIYLIWASSKISVRQDENLYRVERFEEKLKLRPGEYGCILALDKEKWVRTNYATLRDKIIESPGIVFGYLILTHYLGVKFSLKTVEKYKLNYAALGSDSYNWETPEAQMKRRKFESYDIASITHNRRMQTDVSRRYKLASAADAKRHVSLRKSSEP